MIYNRGTWWLAELHYRFEYYSHVISLYDELIALHSHNNASYRLKKTLRKKGTALIKMGYFEESIDNYIKLNKREPLLFFLQRLRDEAHRFAVSSHRMKRKKSLTKSLLDQINGIGRTRKRALLNYFGSARAVESASFDDLKQVDGIETSVAKKIHDFFHD